MGDDQRYDELRELLQDAPPSKKVWQELCDLIEAWEDEDELERDVAPFVDELLTEWSDAQRTAHPLWVERLLEGEHVTPMIIARALDLRCQHLRVEDAELLGESPELLWMTRLNLAYNGLQNEGVIALTASDVIRNLRFLDLSGNSIEAAGIRAIAQCEHLSNLTHLDLTGNWVNDEAAGYLAESEHLANLETLVLRGNPIREDGAAALANSPHLNESIRARWADD